MRKKTNKQVAGALLAFIVLYAAIYWIWVFI